MANYTVSGGGDAALMGTYVPNGTNHNGAARFTNGTGYYAWDAGYWFFSYGAGNSIGSASYRKAGLADTPATGLFDVAYGPAAPAPTVSGAALPGTPLAPTISNITHNSLDVTLPALTSNATSLRLEVQVSGDTYSTVASGLTGGAVQHITGLSPETDYAYRAVAVNADGEAPGSSANSTTLPAPPATPDAPTITPQDATSAQGEAVTFDESWTGLYFAWCAIGSDIRVPTRVPLSDGEPWDIRGLATNQKYYGWLIASNAGGETVGAKVEFRGDFINRVHLQVRTAVLRALVKSLRYEAVGAGNVSEFSESVVMDIHGNEWATIALPEFDADYCVHIVYVLNDGSDTERGGGQLLVNPSRREINPGVGFTPLFSESESGIEIEGEKVFYDVSFNINALVDGAQVIWHNAVTNR